MGVHENVFQKCQCVVRENTLSLLVIQLWYEPNLGYDLFLLELCFVFDLFADISVQATAHSKHNHGESLSRYICICHTHPPTQTHTTTLKGCCQ